MAFSGTTMTTGLRNRAEISAKARPVFPAEATTGISAQFLQPLEGGERFELLEGAGGEVRAAFLEISRERDREVGEPDLPGESRLVNVTGPPEGRGACSPGARRGT